MADPDLEAYAAAERLVREAHERAEAAARAAGAEAPPRGWQATGEQRGPAFPDLSTLTALAEAARGALPPELARQLADALRELLLALRAIIDYSLARLEAPAATEPQIEDIPIE